MAENLVIVESPAKAKTIAGYLGKDYQVLASYGHIRDLPSKKGSVLPEEDFEMRWELSERAGPRLKQIETALKSASKLILATDPDREGEAIAWHLHSVLQDKLKNKTTERVVFHEITKTAVQKAIDNARDINQDLVDAYLARRALDYLVGFSISPLLWRKISRAARSAGRVQSVALRLVCERENEIELFNPQEFWTVEAQFQKEKILFPARLTHFDGEKLGKFSINNEADATRITTQCAAQNYSIMHIKKSNVQRTPPPPFTTSTLQQEAARKLYFRAQHTMMVAQKLYEGINIKGKTIGLISYMRTDSVNLSDEAVNNATSLVAQKFGKKYLLDSPRRYKSKVKNAQEAHEAIRPTHFEFAPSDIRKFLDADQAKLYELIWKRALATQMANAQFEKVAADITNADKKITFRANGSVMLFDGFTRLYMESRDDEPNHKDGDTQQNDNDNDRLLPKLTENEALNKQDVTPSQHFTQAPPRYSDASLVKKLEELGIGRPSTYASILQVLVNRKYVHLDKKRFIPDDIGRIIVSFLELYFPEQVEYDFTAHLEDQLDEVSHGAMQWKSLLNRFWTDMGKLIDRVEEVTPADVSKQLDEKLAFHYFAATQDKTSDEKRKCPSCKQGRLSLRTGKFGAFIACDQYPECRYTAQLGMEANEQDGENGEMIFPKILGAHPINGKEISLRKGPYGLYLQQEPDTLTAEPEPEEAKPKTKGRKKKPAEPKPKRAPLPRIYNANHVTMDLAVQLLALPREIGTYPDTGEMITGGIGRFGPFLKVGDNFVSLKSDDVLEIGINRAVELVSESLQKKRGVILGTHPDSGHDVLLRYGRYGYYIQHHDEHAAVGRKADAQSTDLETALELLAQGAKKIIVKMPAKKAPAKKTATKKTAAKKTTTKKTPTQKTTVKKQTKK
ncbi:MAG: type I DNA topoisomerase [Alphaproteobacteria bacterium]|nr:type I DNA topoisomerase [Alphaproteobacteria bacterium]